MQPLPHSEAAPADAGPAEAVPIRRRQWTRLLPLAVVATGLALVFATGLNRYVSLEMLESRRIQLLALVHAHPVLSVAAYALGYVAVVAFSIPGALVMTLTGGFLFGPVVGSAAAVVGASTGATLMFLVARSAFGDALRRRARAGGMMRKIEEGVRQNAFSCILVLRLIPIMPFWLVNIAAACVRIPLRTYVVATVVGIAAPTFIYSSIGAGFGHVFARGGKPDLRIMFDPQVYLPLFGVALLSLTPILVHAWRGGRRRAAAAAAANEAHPSSPVSLSDRLG